MACASSVAKIQMEYCGKVSYHHNYKDSGFSQALKIAFR